MKNLKDTKLKYQNSIDETLGGGGGYKPEYEIVIDEIQSMSLDRLKFIKKKIDFVLKEQGITFGQYIDGKYKEDIWSLDLIPQIITETEFELIERGIKQRLQALNLLLNDIYSERRILRDKIIPKEIVLGDQYFLRDCVGIKVPGDIYIHLGAFDIVRDPSGNFQILDDNVTIPSGISYAIFNRQILRQLFPNLFTSQQVRPIWDTAAILLSKLKEASHRELENPMVVLLSPGIYNEAYTEHELLANRMGIPLVLPKDLIVKDNNVFMKTVQGLTKVDVIYRRIQDYYIDPVSFYGQSVIGVPGLLSCVRYGNVSIVNAIGCGVGSSKALLPFTDKIIRFYLSEEPILKTVETHLLNNYTIIEHVFSKIQNYIIKEKQGSGGKGVFIGPEMPQSAIKELKQKVYKNPNQYVAQPLIPISHSKYYTPEGLVDRYVETRFYSFLGKEYYLANTVLTRVSQKDTSIMVCNSQGGGSKDTWVLGKSKRTTQILGYTKSNHPTRNFILSRVAESLFWLGRYVNRVLTTANVLQVAYSTEIDQLIGNDDPAYKSLIRVLSRLTGAPMKKIFKAKDAPWHILFFRHAVFDESNLYSMQSNINSALSNAREIQNYLSNDMWVSLKKLLDYISVLPDNANDNISMEELSGWLEEILHNSQYFYGASLDTFSRQDVLQFIQLGRYIEHCNSIILVIKFTIQFIVNAYKTEEQVSKLQPFIIVILKLLKSYEAFQWNYQSRFEPYLAYRMLVIDKDFSNSLVNCLEKIKSTLGLIDNEVPVSQDESPEYICDILISRAFSFNLKEYFSKPTRSQEKYNYFTKRTVEFLHGKEEITPGFWANTLKAGIDLLGNKIIDRYSNVYSPTPFTVVE